MLPAAAECLFERVVFFFGGSVECVRETPKTASAVNFFDYGDDDNDGDSWWLMMLIFVSIFLLLSLGTPLNPYIL